MRTYDKRIGFLINQEHLKPTGGNGQFARSFIRLMEANNIKVDIITDQMPKKYKAYADSLKTNIIYPDDELSYSDHRDTFGKPTSICSEGLVNFRNSVMKALSTNIYDIFICNSPEAIQVGVSLGLEDTIQIIAYTHLESQIFTKTYGNPFLPIANETMRQNLTCSGLYIATQSAFNKQQFANHPNSARVFECPIPITELNLLARHDTERDGVLFIGRWEAGKNYDLFLEVMKQTKLTAKVITSKKGIENFQNAFNEMGIKHDIRADIVGEEKVKFITSCRVAVNTSLVESYGMAFYEQQMQMPTVCLDDPRWIQNFDNRFYYACDKKTMPSKVLSLHTQFDVADKWYDRNPSALDHYVAEEQLVFDKWKACFDHFVPKVVKGDIADFAKQKTVEYKNFIVGLNRKKLSLSNDIRAIYNNRGKFKTIYTDKGTWLTKDETFIPTEVIEGPSLFEGLYP